jgi:adenine-specific DNA-methyltransferase
LFYAKDLSQLRINKFAGAIDEKYKASFAHDDGDGRGQYQTVALVAGGTQRSAKRKSFEFHGVTDQWLYKKETLEQWWQDNRIYKTNGGKYRLKKYLSETEGRLLSDIWIDDEIKALQGGSSEYMGFVTQKPLSLIKRICKLFHNKALILDFFAGSGTTGEAIIESNKDDDGRRKFILCTNNEDNNGDGKKIAEDICYPRIKKVIQGFIDNKSKKIEGFEGNLKYFKTDFVDANPTDRNKKKLVDKSTEMLCLKEDCFDEVKKGHEFKVFKNSQDKYLGIIYDDEGIDEFKKEAKRLKKKFVVYVFSLDESAREEEFEDIADLVELKPIPAVILNVYKRIFK